MALLALGSLYQWRIHLLTAAFNSALAKADVRLLKLEGLQLGWGGGDIEKVVLAVGKNQAPQTLQGLHFTYAVFELRPESVSLKHVELKRATFDDSQPGSSTSKLSDVLRLLMEIPLHSVTIDALVVDGVSFSEKGSPLRLLATLDNGHFRLEVESEDKNLEIELVRLTQDKHAAYVAVATSDGLMGELRGEINLLEGKYQFEGDGGLRLEVAMSLIETLIDFSTVTPAVAGKLLFRFSGQVDDEIELRNGLSLDLEVLPETELDIALAGFDSDINLSLSIPQSLHFSTQYYATQDMAVLLSGNTLAWGLHERTSNVEAEGQLSNIKCQYHVSLGCRLAFDMIVDAEKLMLLSEESLRIRNLVLGLALEVELADDTVSVAVQPGEWLSADSVEQGDIRVLEPVLIADAAASLKYHLPTGDMEFSTDKLQFLLPRLQLPDLNVATLLNVQDLEVSLDSGGELRGSGRLAADTINFQRPDTWLPALGISSKWLLVNQSLGVEGQVLGGGQTPLFSVTTDYQLDKARGTAQLRSNNVSFDHESKRLSQHFSSWPYEWDIFEGQLSVDVDLEWQGDEHGTEFRADIKHRAQGLAGIYKDVGFVGYNSNIDAEIKAPHHIRTVRTATLSVESLDVGVPIEGIHAKFNVDTALQKLTLETAEAHLFGGRLWIDNATYRADYPHNEVYVGVDSMDVDQLLELAGYEAVHGTGVISGLLPLDVNSAGVTMQRGMLAAKAPGGVFRYHSEISAGTNPAMVQVIEALKNYQYSIFQVEADYLDTGDLVLEMLLRGSNPDLQNGRPIHLNLNVTDNIPSLLKSLQSGRVIADSVSRQLGGG